MGRNRRGKNPKAQEIRQGPAFEGAGNPPTQLKGMVRKPSTPVSTEDMELAILEGMANHLKRATTLANNAVDEALEFVAASNERIKKTECNGDDFVMEKCASIILDAGDGTGDGVVELPNTLMIRLGWCVGDTLAVDLLPDGKLHVQLAAPKEDNFSRP